MTYDVRMKEITISGFLTDFSPDDRADDTARSKLNEIVTIRLTPDAKARYDKLQQKSRKKFGKKAREVLLALIEAAEARTA